MNLYEDIIKAVETVLENYPEILFALVFGSAVKHRLTPLSDIDIAVAAERPLSYPQKIALMLSLSESLSREIDLIDLRTVDGLILQQALCTGVVVKKDSTALYAELIKKNVVSSGRYDAMYDASHQKTLSGFYQWLKRLFSPKLRR